MKAREFIPEYDIDPDELHRAAYLQRAVDKYNSRYQNKPRMANPNNPNDDSYDEPKDPKLTGNPIDTFGQNFFQKLADPGGFDDYKKMKPKEIAKALATRAANTVDKIPNAITNALYKSSSVK
jgi:hypothetical protein